MCKFLFHLAHDIIFQNSNALAQCRSVHCKNLLRHHPTYFNQTILRSRRNFNPGSHIIRRKRNHQAYHGRVKTLDFVILHNDNRPRLFRVTSASTVQISPLLISDHPHRQIISEIRSLPFILERFRNLSNSYLVWEPLIFIKGRDEHTQRISRGKTELLCRFTELFRLIIINTCRKLNYHCHSNHYFLSFYILLTCFANIPYLDY